MEYKVAAISNNANCFGLKRFTFIGKDGSGYGGYGNALRCRIHPEGTVVELGSSPEELLAFRGFGSPGRLSHNASDALCRHLWGSEARTAPQTGFPPVAVFGTALSGLHTAAFGAQAAEAGEAAK